MTDESPVAIVRSYHHAWTSPETSATSTTPAAELFTIRNGRISESVLIFDRMSYGPPKPA